MKTFALALVCLLLGSAVGGMVAYVHVGSGSSADGITSSVKQIPTTAKTGNAPPKVEVDNIVFNFGVMERSTKRKHDFLFTNTGKGPLRLSVGNTTCKCTVGQVPDGDIPPGTTVPVTLEWTAKTHAPEFRQNATIFTNDPTRKRLTLTVEGKVTTPTSFTPSDFRFERVALGEPKTAEVFILSHRKEPFEITGYEFIGTDKQDAFTVKILPAEKKDLPDPLATSGYRVQLTLQETEGFGAFHGWLRFKTNLKGVEVVEIPFSGRVVSDISLFGALYNDKNGVLRLGVVPSDTGKEVKMLILIKGKHAKETQVKVKENYPEYLTASLGEPKKSQNGNVTQIPLLVHVAPGAPNAVFAGGKTGEYGRILLETTHPNIPEIEIRVRFTVQNAAE